VCQPGVRGLTGPLPAPFREDCQRGQPDTETGEHDVPAQGQRHLFPCGHEIPGTRGPCQHRHVPDLLPVIGVTRARGCWLGDLARAEDDREVAQRGVRIVEIPSGDAHLVGRGRRQLQARSVVAV